MGLIDSGLKRFSSLSPDNLDRLSFIAWGCENGIFGKEDFTEELIVNGFNSQFASSYVDSGIFSELRSQPVFSMAKVREDNSIPLEIYNQCSMWDYWVCDTSRDQPNASKWGCAYHFIWGDSGTDFIIYIVFGHPFSADKSKGESSNWVFKGFVITIGGDQFFWSNANGKFSAEEIMKDIGCASKGNYDDNAQQIIKAYKMKRCAVRNPLNCFD